MVIVIFFLLAMAPNQLAIHSPNIPSGPALTSPNFQHWLGTDDLGIDLWAQICHGAQISMMVGLGTAFLAVGGGSILGVFAGYYGGKIDGWLMRLIDLMMVIPELPTMIVLGSFFGPSMVNIMIVLTLFSWTRPARIIRSKVISIKEENYVKVTESYGGGFIYITRRHFLPQTFPLIMVSFIKLVSKAIVAEASLAFLGLGDPTSKSWGLILNHAMSFQGIYFIEFWKWWILFPLLCIMTMVLAISFISKEIENLLC
ncbi:binding-protein-dependent transport systems inner membrane component [Alkaliphilus metalliredigens QYMF]|uniref:Binding-protein-dependent transport systems inner membrane component n=2 Tax=Alkaliphilus TaxID=114627 RepID=A6TNE0_ALKMQ|nr:binding-protein-dependent transport systems inner membrane component [Alkaliphilus metalliredigens QYMF]